MVERTLKLAERSKKPRKTGLTAITDLGVPISELKAILESYHDFMDIAKLGIGTGYLEPNLREKIELYTAYEIPVYFGGTLFEKYRHQDKLNDYLLFLDNLGVKTIEVASGIIDFSPEETVKLIHRLKRDFTVLAEVGKKTADNSPAPKEWISQTQAFLDAGCQYVILEGRNSGNVGIYDSNGTLDTILIKAILEHVDKDRLIFEAPTAQNQSQVINKIGNNANMGNVCTRDLLLVEALRKGLREETFFI